MEEDDRHGKLNGARQDTSQDVPDKGKGREKPDAGDGVDKDSSMISRLENSARMAGSTFVSAKTGLPDIPTTLGDKGASSGASFSTNASGHGSAHSGRHVSGEAATRPVFKKDVGEAFRPTQRETAGSSKAFDNFVGAHQPLPDVAQVQLQPGAPIRDEAQKPLSTMSVDGSVAQVEATDGSAVAHLLSLPDDPEMLQTLVEQEEKISAEDAAKLRAALFNDGSSGRLPWDHLLNFTPDFVSTRNPSERSRVDGDMQLGIADQDLAADIWLRQWHDVLSAYTDEVWGDLNMLVEEAKQEVEKDLAGEGGNRPENTALSRLKMILAHVRGFS